MPDESVANTISTARLDAFRVLIISGPDRVGFLQGQLTQDVTQLIAAGDEIWWPLPTDIVAGVAKRLKMFVLRSAVKIVISTLPISGLFGVAGLDHLQIAGRAAPIGSRPSQFADGSLVVRVAGDPDRAWLIGPTAEATGFGPAKESAWILQSIRTGLPYIVAATQELFVPQMLNLDLIGAISFDKGCYVGQEIVARTQNLGRIKRRMYRFITDSTAELAPGAGIYGPDNATGKVVLSSENEASGELLAVVPINAANGPWFADAAQSHELVGQPLPYLAYEQAPSIT